MKMLLTFEERQLINTYRKLDERGKRNVMYSAKSELEYLEEEPGTTICNTWSQNPTTNCYKARK